MGKPWHQWMYDKYYDKLSGGQTEDDFLADLSNLITTGVGTQVAQGENRISDIAGGSNMSAAAEAANVKGLNYQGNQAISQQMDRSKMNTAKYFSGLRQMAISNMMQHRGLDLGKQQQDNALLASLINLYSEGASNVGTLAALG